jgi:indole-3-glycerol phosphate synthase/phosphoribosylanthranilate isomerase
VTGIRDQIVARRRERVRREGHALGVAVPAVRTVPLVPFLRDPGVICEIKRRSPSRGDIDATLDPVTQASRYAERGIRSLSVLTEEDHFSGSLRDLIDVKQRQPELAVLRKDFLLDEEDIELSYRAGADAVLLIASILSADELAHLHAEARRLGMAALVEVHDEDDVSKTQRIEPELVGINARDLATFSVDLLAPLRVSRVIDWEHRTVFESGIFTREDARLVASTGFDGILVGEAVVRDPDRIAGLIEGFTAPREGVTATSPGADFWQRLAGRRTNLPRPLVKVCGITNREDAEIAAERADLLGFVFAESPRSARPQLLSELRDLPVLKVAVVVSGGTHGPLDPVVADLLESGLIDAIQFHGDESPDECALAAFPYYRAVRLGRPEDAGAISRYGCPRVLVDARSSGAYGGTGKQLAPKLVQAAAAAGPLWLAGGINDENVAAVVSSYRPELIDASSGLEREPGRKDHRRLTRFFEEIERARDI